MDILGQSALIVSLVAFTLAATALSRNFMNKVVMAYALVCTVISAWAFSFFMEKIFATGTFYRFHLTFNLVLAPAGLFFVRVLTRVDSGFMRWLFRFSVFYAVILIILEWVGLGGEGILQQLAFYAPSTLLIVCFYLLFLDWQLRHGKISRAKISTLGLSRRSWIYAGAVFMLVTAAMDHAPFLGDIIPAIGNIFLCIYLFLISEAVIHQRLLNLSGLLNRVFVLVFISLGFTIIYGTFVAWIQDAPALFVLNSFLASFIILLLVDPARKLAEIGVVRIFSRKYLAFQQMVEQAQSKLVGVLDLRGLADLTLKFLEDVLQYESASVFVLGSDGTKFRRIRGVLDEPVSGIEVLSNHPIVEFFYQMRRRGEAPIILDQYLINEIDRTTSQTQKQAFDLVLKAMIGLHSNIAMPFFEGDTVLGFVAVRANKPPAPWGNNWGVLSVVYPFFIQASRTLRNMDVYVRLREKDRLATLGEMAAGLAHEIRNPLGAIKGAAQCLEPQAEAPQGAFVQIIIEEVNRLNNVVAQFLDYARPIKLQLEPYDLRVLIERTADLFKNGLYAAGDRAVSKPPAIELASPAGRLPKVPCVPEQIKQVLVNLIQNSIQSLAQSPPDHGGIVRLGAFESRSRDGVPEVVFFVEDNGRGIARENVERIFIPFFTTSPGGTGLGLPICSRIVEAHGGRIELSSETDRDAKWTRFSVHLPLSVSETMVGVDINE